MAHGLEPGDCWFPGWPTGEVLGTLSQSPPRAEILGAGDAKLVTYRSVVNVGIDKPQLASADPADVRHPARPAGGSGPGRLRPAGPGGRPRGLRHRHHPARGRPDHHRRTDRRDSRRPRHPRLPPPGPHPHLRPRPAGHRSRGQRRTDREIRRAHSKPGTRPAAAGSSSNTTRSCAAATEPRSSPKRPASQPRNGRPCSTAGAASCSRLI